MNDGQGEAPRDAQRATVDVAQGDQMTSNTPFLPPMGPSTLPIDAPGVSTPTPSTVGALVGRTFGNYVVDRLLATGGMGEVYTLRHTTLAGRWRVLKVILPTLSSNALVRARFEREAHAVAQLGDHDNIVGIDDFGSMADGQLWMIMPFVSGKPLDGHLAENGGRLPPYRVLELLCPIALGVDHAHARGVIHRDLKPSNVFVTTTSNGVQTCKVLDWGIARQTNANLPSTTQHMALGTPSYMAVEQYENAADADATSDVYALACMIWEMVTSAPPWQAQDMAVLYQKKLHEPPAPPLGNALPPGWEAILRSALSVDRARRPQSVRELIQVLAAALPGSPPFVPSGLDVLHRLAPKLEERLPDDLTLRRPDRSSPSDAAPASIASRSTTLGSSTGVITPAASPKRWKLAGLSMVVISVAGLGTYAVAVVNRGSGNAPSSAPTPVEPAGRTESAATPRGLPRTASGSEVEATPSPPQSPPSSLSPASRPGALPSSQPPAGPAAPNPAVPKAMAPAAIASPAVAPIASTTRGGDTPAPPPPTLQPKATSAVAPTSPATGAMAPRGSTKLPAAHTRASMTDNDHRLKATQERSSEPAQPHKFDPNAVGGQE